MERGASVTAVERNNGFQKWRADTPGCEAVCHFNHAGASLPPKPVIDAVSAYLECEARIGGYEAADEQAETLSMFYQHAAKLIGADPSEIAFTQSATEAAFSALISIDWKPGDRVLVHESEYTSNLMALSWLKERFGLEIDVVETGQDGQFDPADFQRAVSKRTRLICVTHLPTFSGAVQAAAEVGQIAKNHGVLYALDACQSVGHLNVNVEEMKCDFLYATGRKYLRGPRASGFLYVRSSILEKLKPLADLHGGQGGISGLHYYEGARRFERFEFSRSGQAGLSAALDYALDIGIPTITAFIVSAAQNLHDRLSIISGLSVDPPAFRQSGIVTIKSRFDSNDLMQDLRRESIHTSVSLRPNGEQRLRLSAHYLTNEDDIERAASAIEKLVNA
ncbi:MAG: aminotransferase class V-fold PLP-dependent enzyme [Pseudomonadota bacterium]